MKYCKICNRELDTYNPLSMNIGDDCADCMIKAETDIGDYLAALNIAIKVINKFVDQGACVK